MRTQHHQNPTDKMTPAQERGVRRALAFAEMLDHPSLVRCMGNWECEDYIYIGKDGVGLGWVGLDGTKTPRWYDLNGLAPFLEHSHNPNHCSTAHPPTPPHPPTQLRSMSTRVTS